MHNYCIKIHNKLHRPNSIIILLIIFFLLPFNLVRSQDIIFLIDGSEIISKVYEITPDYIKYKLFDELDGPIRNVSIKDVFKIKYENGKQEMFNNQFIEKETIINQQRSNNPKTNASRTNEVQPPQKTPSKQSFETQQKGLLLSLGYGNSFGGLGVNLGINISSLIQPHFGVGWFPLSVIHEGADDMFLVTGGLRVFITGQEFKFRSYIDAQFGMLGGEYNETSIYQGGNLVSTTKKQQALYGPTIMLGSETFGKRGKIGGRLAGGGSYNLAKVEWTNVGFLWAVDIGLIIKLY